jgi:hypothetical protein
MHHEHTHAHSPAVGFQSNITEDHTFYTLGAHAYQVAQVGKYQKNKTQTADIVFDGKEVEGGVDHSAKKR